MEATEVPEMQYWRSAMNAYEIKKWKEERLIEAILGDLINICHWFDPKERFSERENKNYQTFQTFYDKGILAKSITMRLLSNYQLFELYDNSQTICKKFEPLDKVIKAEYFAQFGTDAMYLRAKEMDIQALSLIIQIKDYLNSKLKKKNIKGSYKKNQTIEDFVYDSFFDKYRYGREGDSFKLVYQIVRKEVGDDITI